MADDKVCGVCNKAEAIDNCSECGIALCQDCVCEVMLTEHSVGYNVKGVAISPVRAGEKMVKVCANCLEEMDY